MGPDPQMGEGPRDMGRLSHPETHPESLSLKLGLSQFLGVCISTLGHNCVCDCHLKAGQEEDSARDHRSLYFRVKAKTIYFTKTQADSVGRGP